MSLSPLVGSYIEHFDEALGGGIPEGHIVLVHGSAGTMKSSFCFNILFNEIAKGKKGVYISIEQSALSLLKQMVGLGYDLSKVNLEVLNDADDVLKGLARLKEDEPHKLTLVDFGTIRKQLKKQSGKKGTPSFIFDETMVQTITEITGLLSEKKLCDIVVLDSLNAVNSLIKSSSERNQIFYLFEFFRDLGLTSLIISEEASSLTTASFGVEGYLADGIIILQLNERNRKVTREIRILKMRNCACNNDVFTLEFDGKKFRALYGGKIPLV